jgi:hypothetical protein
MVFFQFEPACALRVDGYHISVFSTYASGIVKDTGRDGDTAAQLFGQFLAANNGLSQSLQRPITIMLFATSGGQSSTSHKRISL